MYLVQLLLPLVIPESDASGGERAGGSAAEVLTQVRAELLDRFGGITAYSRAPARGAWEGGGGVQHDDVLVLEVMIESLDRGWWVAYRQELEQRLRQQELVVRVHAI